MSLLTVVVDVGTARWSTRRGHDELVSLKGTFEALVIFFSAHLLMHRQNQLRVVASHESGAVVLYPSSGGPTPSSMKTQVMAQLEALLGGGGSGGSSGGGAAIASALSKALCHANRAKQANPALSCRVLVLQAARDLDSEYNTIMNCVFAAQKLGVVVDTCVLSREPSTFMQQAADQTGGAHVHLQKGKDAPAQPLLQQLLMAFLPSADERRVLQLPHATSIDLRAACFCHQWRRPSSAQFALASFASAMPSVRHAPPRCGRLAVSCAGKAWKITKRPPRQSVRGDDGAAHGRRTSTGLHAQSWFAYAPSPGSL
mmetsp:Transcript_40537/g.108496  ORF Transcript_40537/g.108496 Transcript_40537/m.108496 type:complete len:314 (-) Transcript_40537:39-980(-)